MQVSPYVVGAHALIASEIKVWPWKLWSMPTIARASGYAGRSSAGSPLGAFMAPRLAHLEQPLCAATPTRRSGRPPRPNAVHDATPKAGRRLVPSGPRCSHGMRAALRGCDCERPFAAGELGGAWPLGLRTLFLCSLVSQFVLDTLVVDLYLHVVLDFGQYDTFICFTTPCQLKMPYYAFA